MAARKKTASKTKRTSAKKTTARKAPAKRKTAARKAPAKRTAAKRPAAKKRTTAAKKRPVAKKRTTAKRTTKRTTAKKRTSNSNIAVGRKPFTKSQFVAALCEQTGLARKDIVSVLECIPDIVSAHVKKQGPEVFSWPGMFKIQVIKKPATKARQGINPFTGESMMFKAKPASRRVKIRPLKQLKEMAA